MKNLVLVLFLLVAHFVAVAESPAARPRITAIDHVAFYTTSPDGVKHLYTDILGLSSAAPVERGETVRYMSGRQWVGYSPAPDPKSTDRMDHVESEIEPFVSAGGVVVSDRYDASSLAYQSVSSGAEAREAVEWKIRKAIPLSLWSAAEMTPRRLHPMAFRAA